MNIVVVGMGEVGTHVVRVLQENHDHDVVALDNNQARLARVEEEMDVATAVGFGANPSVLRSVGAHQADLVVAVTNNDAVNLVASLMAKRMGASRAVARIQGKDYDEGTLGVHHDMLGIDMVVNPHVLVAQEITQIARSHGALDVQGLAGNRLELVELELPRDTKVARIPLRELNMPHQTLVVAVVREGRLFVPGGDDTLHDGDHVYLVGRTGLMEDVEDLFCGGREAAHVSILGGTVVGETLARCLTRAGTRVSLLEPNEKNTRMLSAELPDVDILQLDGTQLHDLEAAEINRHDLVCAVNHQDEMNLMSCLLSKQLGAPRTLSLVHNDRYSPIYKHLGIDIVLSPLRVASEHILQYVQQTDLQALHFLHDEQALVLELRAPSTSPILDTPLHELELPTGIIVAGIVSTGKVRVAHGSDMIHTGDTVVILTTKEAKHHVDRLFSSGNH